MLNSKELKLNLRRLLFFLVLEVPNGFLNPTCYPIFSFIPDPTRFSFENPRVTGILQYQVLPKIVGKLEFMVHKTHKK